jgi:hypothetical protein
MVGCSCGAGHVTYGACLRAKNIRVEGCRSHIGRDRSFYKANQKELDLYADARKQGVAPAGTKTAQIREALDVSDRIGRAFNAATDDKYVTE